jgi:hypothetical protein
VSVDVPHSSAERPATNVSLRFSLQWSAR